MAATDDVGAIGYIASKDDQLKRLRRIEAALAKGQTPLSRAEAKALYQRVEPMVWRRLLDGTQWRAGSDAEGLPKVLMRRSLPET